jgi:Mg/Co/Ni transporter MgtE
MKNVSWILAVSVAAMVMGSPIPHPAYVVAEPVSAVAFIPMIADCGGNRVNVVPAVVFVSAGASRLPHCVEI